MVNLSFLHMWAWEGVRVGGAFAGWVLAYYPGRWTRRAIIRKLALR